MKPIRVLIVDDSAFMRKMIGEIVMADPELELAGAANDGVSAIRMTHELRPDVITMDVEMPVMDGEKALIRIMNEVPTPVVMLSSLTKVGSELTVRCLAEGAVDAICKPSGSTSLDIKTISNDIVGKIKHAAVANVKAKAIAPATSTFEKPNRSGQIGLVVIGCSTGGPKALQTLVPMLPADLGVPVVIVQHMPPQFTASLAQRLNQLSQIEVKEARPGDALKPGIALLAPGGVHLKFDAMGIAHLSDEPPIHGVRPAIDVTVASLVAGYGAKMLGILLTGMGRDGAAGLRAIKDAGGHTIAEHESSCVVYGMPRAAVESGAAIDVIPLPNIASAVEALVRSSKRNAA